MQAGLAALGDAARSAPARSRPAAARRKPGLRRGAPRAPRGANRAKILAAASERPRKVAEIAEITGIPKPVVASTVSTLTRRGVMRRTASGGYRTVSDPQPTRSNGRRPR